MYLVMLWTILLCPISDYNSGGVVARVLGDYRRLRLNIDKITQLIVVHAYRTPVGRLLTEVKMAEPRNRPTILIPADCALVPGAGRGISDTFFVRYYEDNAVILVLY